MAACVIGPQKLEYFVSNLSLDERIELCQMHIVLYDFQQKQQSLWNLVDLIIDNDLVSDDSKVANELFLDHHAGFSPHTVDEHAWLEVSWDVVSDWVVFIT